MSHSVTSPVTPATNYLKLYASRDGAKLIQQIYPFATGTASEAEAVDAAAKAREFHRSNGWRVRLSVWQHTAATRSLRGCGLVGEGVGALQREWRERVPKAAEVVTAGVMATEDESEAAE